MSTFSVASNYWISDEYPFSSNIKVHERTTPDEVNRIAGHAKIALNICPWQKDGANERPFNNMLNGAVCLTDTSDYLLERFTHGKELVFYQLDDLDQMAENAKYIIDNPMIGKKIAETGYNVAKMNDTWACRFREFLKYIN